MSSTTTALPQVSTTVWNIDPAHSVAEFKVRHMMIANVKGQFPKLSGVLTLDESDLAKSSVDVSIEASSIETRDAQRDAHLKSADSHRQGSRTFCRRQLDDPRRYSPGQLYGGGANATDQGSLGQHARSSLRDHQDQSKRFWVDLECGT